MNFKVILFFVLFCHVLDNSEVNSSCGFRNVSIDGLTKIGDWPWVTAFVYKPENSFFCTGSLISKKHVLSGNLKSILKQFNQTFSLSAAHCFHQKWFSNSILPEDVTAMLGKFDLSVFDEPGSLNSSINEIIIHPEWNANDFSYHADITIIVLSDSIEFSENIRAVCLPQKSFEKVTGSGFVFGWGQSKLKHALKPKEIEIPVQSDAKCFMKYPQIAEIASSDTFCGGYENQGKGPCLGDSGGGLFFHDFTSSSWNVRGIISASILDNNRNCDLNKYQLYTNVARFIDWIDKIMLNENDGKLK
jgi:secreted trypsin-like serine protease